jgi:hypothetical protein
MTSKWSGLCLGLCLVAVANIGALWFGRSFKITIVVVVLSVFFLVWMWVRRTKHRLVESLLSADKATQDEVLAGLDEEDRSEILRQLGRETK